MAPENVELRKVGLKVTLPRVKILSILETAEAAEDAEGDHHLSAEDVYKKLWNPVMMLGWPRSIEC